MPCSTFGAPKVYKSSEQGRRYFCGKYGTGVSFANSQLLPWIIDNQNARYNDPTEIQAKAHIQAADRIEWMKTAHTLPEFDRYPPLE